MNNQHNNCSELAITLFLTGDRAPNAHFDIKSIMDIYKDEQLMDDMDNMFYAVQNLLNDNLDEDHAHTMDKFNMARHHFMKIIRILNQSEGFSVELNNYEPSEAVLNKNQLPPDFFDDFPKIEAKKKTPGRKNVKKKSEDPRRKLKK